MQNGVARSKLLGTTAMVNKVALKSGIFLNRDLHYTFFIILLFFYTIVVIYMSYSTIIVNVPVASS